ncbi:tRNA (adenine(22)-N(1))-methyltransferase TrmK [Sulfobacillus harzensis]|uniref:SAM-dependent methyltransferase n=1 Tax=Sulfobacillus harzensis TaxID=2729629 RepID=A0A7Y0L1Z6_9FIRM|nr:tRNA (adenine(22)-N(1))-methyltransferase TrmK [Sulfobacillus harzensis]NMP21745.1 SAM-dependent methyltransferase [Sulfobacillus harzensis]
MRGLLCQDSDATGGDGIRRLSPRLELIHSWCAPYRVVADIGAHAGLLARRLDKEGHQVTATEITPHGYAMLRESLAGTSVEVLAGDGLEPLKGRSLDLLVISGMGYDTILKILERLPVLSKQPQIIVQPMQGAFLMHRAIADRGWHVVKADIALQRRRLYPVWLLNVSTATSNLEDPLIPTEFRGSPYYRSFLEAELAFRQKAIPMHPTAARENQRILDELETIT